MEAERWREAEDTTGSESEDTTGSESEDTTGSEGGGGLGGWSASWGRERDVGLDGG